MTQAKAEYEAFWSCPKCANLTERSDETDEWGDGGDYLNVVCHHMSDYSKDDSEDNKCSHEYTVIL